MPWKTMDVREQRVKFVVAASRREKPFSTLCEEFGIFRPTGQLWLQRNRETGVEGIAERSRRPHHSPRQTTCGLEEQVVKRRRRYPDWGALKLQVLLSQAGVDLTRSTIHRILLRHDLVREQDRHLSGVGGLRAYCSQRAVGERIYDLRRAGWNADGSRQPVVERPGRIHGSDQAFTVADEARHSLALEPRTPSPNPGQGRAFPRCAATRARATRCSIPGSATLVRRVSLGAQPCASARSAGDENTRESLAS